MSTCSQCNKSSSLRCALCHTARYCSKECQRQHWTTHKSVCHDMEAKAHETLGKNILALSADHPIRQAMTKFFETKSPQEILQMLESDPDYMRRKRELDQLLTPHRFCAMCDPTESSDTFVYR